MTMLRFGVLVGTLVAQTWHLEGPALSHLWIEGITGRMKSVEINRLDSIPSTQLKVWTSSESFFHTRSQEEWSLTIPPPDDSVLLAWAQQKGSSDLVVTAEGRVLSQAELRPHLTLTHRIGLSMLVGFPLSFFTGFLYPFAGFWVAASSAKHKDIADAVRRWKTGTYPSQWNPNELVWILGIGRHWGGRMEITRNRWAHTSDAWTTDLEFWSYTQHLIAVGYRLRLYDVWVSEEDRLGFVLATWSSRGVCFQQMIRIAPLHGPWFFAAGLLGVGYGYGVPQVHRWREGYQPLAFEDGTSGVSLLWNYGAQIWVRVPNPPCLVSLEILREKGVNSMDWQTIQVGFGYAF